MKFLFWEDSSCDNLCTSNVNARWRNPSTIHDNAWTISSYGDAKNGNKEGFMEYKRVWTWYQEGTEELEDIMLHQEHSTRGSRSILKNAKIKKYIVGRPNLYRLIYIIMLVFWSRRT